MDSSKVGVKSTYSFCGFGDVDIVISDDNLLEEFVRSAGGMGYR